jgi:cytochrome c
MGRAKDSVSGYAYSGALKQAGDPTWTYASLNKFLWKPKAYASGTKMNYLGVKKPEDRAALIAYLRSLSDSPKALPTDEQIAAEAAVLAPPPATSDKETPAAPAATPTPAAVGSLRQNIHGVSSPSPKCPRPAVSVAKAASAKQAAGEAPWQRSVPASHARAD